MRFVTKKWKMVLGTIVFSTMLAGTVHADETSYKSVVNSIRGTGSEEPVRNEYTLGANEIWALDTLPEENGILQEAGVYYTAGECDVYDIPSGSIVKRYKDHTPVLVEEIKDGWGQIGDGWIWLENLVFVISGSENKTIPEQHFYKNIKNILEEYKTAEVKYISDSAVVVSNKYRENDYEYFLTHIMIKNGSQIKGGLSYDQWGGSQEKPTDFAERKDAFLVINGSYFSYATGTPLASPAGIYDNNIASNAKANGAEICIAEDGSLFSPYNGESLDRLIENGVTATLSTADPLLIAYGQKMDFSYRNDDYKYPRSAIGEMSAGEYYLITAGNGTYKGGMSYTDLQNKFFELGCVYARSFDGGGSVALVIDKKLINTPATGSERPVADFLYFTDN